jgi:hypothetical protein
VLADHRVPGERVVHPAEGDVLPKFGDAGHLMGAHERLEGVAGALGLALVHEIVLRPGQAAHHVDRDELGHDRAQREALDQAAEAPPEQQRGLQDRGQEVVGFDRDENAFHAGDPSRPGSTPGSDKLSADRPPAPSAAYVRINRRPPA